MVSEHNENEEDAEASGGHGKEVDRDQVPDMVSEERPPGLRRLRTPLRDQARDGALGHVEAELQELAMDSWGAPERVRGDHACDQDLDLGVDRRPPSGGPAGELGPVLAEATPLSPQDGVRNDDHEGVLPTGKHSCQPNPEEAIASPKLRAFGVPLIYGQLLAQRQVLEGELAVAAAEEREESKQAEQGADHRTAIVAGSEPQDQPTYLPDGVLAKDRCLMAGKVTWGSMVIPCVVLLGLNALAPSLAQAQFLRIELHQVASTTLSDQQFLTGLTEGLPATLGAELRIPRPGTDRLPAVVLLHGSGGLSGGREARWADELNGMGVATLMLDSFTGRRIVSTGDNQAQLGRLAMIVDAYRSLELLSKHPRIDPARVALMGFSRGGQATLYASLKRFQRMHGPRGVEFAGYLPFYANCGTTFIDDGDVAARPIHLFHGSADDYVPVAPCRSYVARLRASGKNVQLTEYPGARHVFDNPFLTTPVVLKESQTTRSCLLEENPVGQIINSRTKQPFGYEDPCIERGPTIAYDPQAHAEAIKAVKAFLGSTLKLKP
jgi:dienelactone hydrolase